MNPKNILIALALTLTLALAACSGDAETTGTTGTGAVTVAEEATAESVEETIDEAASDASGESTVYTVDTAASSVEWRGEKPLQYGHVGTIDIADGQLTFAGDQLTGSNFVIDMTTIQTTDLEGKDKTDLEGHLNSDDFFGVETYPTATLVIKSVEPTDTDGQYTATADLTMKEITKEITFVTDVVSVDDESISATADIVIDRSEFDVRFGSGSFFDDLGDRLISDEIELTVMLVANS